MIPLSKVCQFARLKNYFVLCIDSYLKKVTCIFIRNLHEHFFNLATNFIIFKLHFSTWKSFTSSDFYFCSCLFTFLRKSELKQQLHVRLCECSTFSTQHFVPTEFHSSMQLRVLYYFSLFYIIFHKYCISSK